MNMASKDNIDLVLDKPGFVYDSHGFPFHVVIHIAIIHWTMHEHDEPGCLTSVYFRKLTSEPFVLRCVFTCKPCSNNLNR